VQIRKTHNPSVPGRVQAGLFLRFDTRAHVRLDNLSCTRYSLSTLTTIDVGC